MFDNARHEESDAQGGALPSASTSRTGEPVMPEESAHGGRFRFGRVTDAENTRNFAGRMPEIMHARGAVATGYQSLPSGGPQVIPVVMRNWL
jgi:hypothetical protein